MKYKLIKNFEYILLLQIDSFRVTQKFVFHGKGMLWQWKTSCLVDNVGYKIDYILKIYFTTVKEFKFMFANFWVKSN